MSAIRRVLVFSLTATVVYGLVTAVGALVAPPDPYTQLAYTVPGLLAGAAIAYYLVYAGGYDRLRDRLAG